MTFLVSITGATQVLFSMSSFVRLYFLSFFPSGCVERSPPFTLDPALLSRLFHNLQIVSRDGYGTLYSKLFARFVTDALPRMNEQDLESHIAEVHELKAQMKREQDQLHFSRAEGGSDRNPACKRSADDGD